jgi:murein hydrolase activator
VQEAVSGLPPTDTYSDKPFSGQRGKLPWPARGKLIARYGQPKAGGKLSWKGHWIGAAEGAPVRAVARGRVVYVGWMHRYGLIVLVEHDGGYYSLYGHAQSATVSVGDSLRAGQVLARAGSTGGHEQPGVYFELRKGTKPIDPRQWLAR